MDINIHATYVAQQVWHCIHVGIQLYVYMDVKAHMPPSDVCNVPSTIPVQGGENS